MSTRKLLMSIIAMVILLAAAVTAYVLVDKSKQKEENAAAQENAALSLFSFDADSVNSVSITNDEGFFQIGLDADGGWMLQETDYSRDFLLNTYYINSICSYMSNLTALKKVDIGENDLSAYGLETPAILTCTVSGMDYTLYLGNASATQEYWYVMKNDTVFGIDYNVGEVLRGGTAYLKDPYMIHFTDVSISSVSLEKDGEPIFSLSIGENGLWTMQEPLPDANVNSAQVSSMLTSITRLQMDSYSGYADELNLADFGLDQPAYKLTLKTDTEEQVIDFAPFTDEDLSTHILDEGSGQVAVMTHNTLSFLKAQPEEFLSSTLVNIPFADAKALDVTVDDLHFTMQMEDGQYYLDAVNISELDSNINGLFKNLYDTVANISYESLEIDADLPEDPAPACNFRFTDTAGNLKILSLVPSADENLYYAYLNARYSGFTVRRRALSGTTGVLNYLEKMTDALAEAGISYTPDAAAVPEETELSDDAENEETSESTPTETEISTES